MSQRIALALAAALTAFILVVVGGLATRLTTQAPVAAAPTEAPAAAAPTAAPALDPQVEAAIAERDAAYQQALAEANARIAAANAQVVQANTQLQEANARIEEANSQPVVVEATAAPREPAPAIAAPAAPAPTAIPIAPSYAINADQAATIAQSVSYGAAPTTTPELVSLQGIPAYEIAFPQGLVYVDANSGAVLASSLPAPAASSGGASEEHEEHEHEEHEHEEHEHEEHEGGDDD